MCVCERQSVCVSERDRGECVCVRETEGSVCVRGRV